ncbi:unnamed protein product [Candidula unifasciata]|uniref:Death domain-containing protein n=1 Tax=Candidula unifasciata TaxID=100452 RepID=A0A8S3ZMB5_9EUPU|nr:unnamed protein product [Candidula unifasciata]
METLIADTSFVHDSADKHEEFMRALRQSLSVLQEKLTTDDQPIHATAGWNQVLETYKQLCNFCKEKLNYDTTGQPDAQKAIFSFIVHLLENDLSMLHLQIAYFSIRDRSFELKEYIQGLNDTSLRPLIMAVCQRERKEAGVDTKAFCDMYERVMIQLFRDTLKKEQSKMFTNELLDLSVYLYLDCIHLEEDSYKMLATTGKNVLNSLDDPFTNIKDINRLKSYLKHSGEVITQPSFASSEKTADVVKDFIESFVTKLSKRGLVKEVYNEVFDLLLCITKCPFHENGFDIKLFEEVMYFFIRIPDKILSKSAELFTAMAKRYTNLLDEMDMRYLNSGRYADTVLSNALKKLYADNKEVARQWLEMLVPLFKKPCEDTMRACYLIVSNDKGYKWKDYPDIAHQVADLITAFQPPNEYDVTNEAEQKKLQEFLKIFKSAVEYFFDGLKKSRMLKDYGRPMACLSLKLLESKNTELLELSEAIAERTELNPKVDKEFMIEMIKKFHLVLKNEDHLWNESWPLQRAANDFIEHCMDPFKDGKAFTDEELRVFVSVCVTSLSYDCVHPETGQFPSVYFLVFLTIIKVLFNWLSALNKMNLAEELVPRLMKCLEVDDESVVQLCAVYLNMLGKVSSGQQAVAPYLDDLIKIYLEKRQDMLLLAINEIYPCNPKALKNHFRSLMELLEETIDTSVLTYLGMLFQKVSTKQAELFTEQDVEILLNKAQKVVNSQTTFLGIVSELCKRRPECLVPHIDLLLDHSLWNPVMSSYYIKDMLSTLAIYKEDLAPRVLDDMFLTAKSSQDKSSLVTALNSIRMIGFKYPELLKPMRSQLDQMQLVDVDAVNMRQTILDMIDGKTSEDMLKKLHKQQEDIQNLVGRVDDTEEAVTDVKNELERQGEQLETTKKTVDEQGQHLDEIQQTVDETVIKVEEIDQKTLSHAPFWARDVSKLLNPVSEHDWRLLSRRLGYSNDDIRGWAQQADPCMAMLNEWYAVRKTSEATYAVLTQLQEMDRMDTAIIVENAMKNSEAVVEDEGFEYTSPPEIFLSYQWGHQPEVKLLKQHLEMAGYECWLDIGQMGGGDKLFEKIDKGIRGAKIIISCVTAKYAKSPNCNREVNLAVSLNKPVIPLLLESCTWPPPGSMGPIFSEYLFVRFYQRGGEELSDDRYWPKEKFQELLLQINTFGLPPNEKKIDQVYKNWWMPVVQEIKIDKNKTKNGGYTQQMEPSVQDLKAAESPDVFISYQWGKQKHIIKLYERLTSLGFTCWLDIKQMGGGDSLYDKIDRGLRGCKVVVSCVTQKYALSANCRREVSLADALKKPLLPLLLEQMTWPPSGPMSMVLSQLLYINCAKDESVQMTWDGQKFTELVNNIKKYVPMELQKDPPLKKDKFTEPVKDKTKEPMKDNTELLKDNNTEPVKAKNAEPMKNKNTEPVKDKNTEPVKDKNTEPVKDKNTVLVKVKNTEPVKDKNTEPVKDKNAEPVKDKNAEPVKDKNTEPLKDKSTEPVKDKNTEPVKDKNTELSHNTISVSSKFKITQSSPDKISEPSKDKTVPLSVKSNESSLNVTSNQELKVNASDAQTTIISENSRKVTTPQSVTPDSLKGHVRKQQRLLKPIHSDPSKNVPPASKAEMTSRSPVRKQLSQKPKATTRPLRLPPLQHSKSPAPQVTSVQEKFPQRPRVSVVQKKKASG